MPNLEAMSRVLIPVGSSPAEEMTFGVDGVDDLSSLR